MVIIHSVHHHYHLVGTQPYKWTYSGFCVPGKLTLVIISYGNLAVFQAAVPKSMALALAPPSSPMIPAGGSVTQQLEVTNPNKAVLKMKLKLGFVAGGIPISDQGEVAAFPAVLYS